MFNQNGGSLYLVQNDRIGTGLIDAEQGRVYDAGPAVLSAAGNWMQLDLDQAEAITPSGVDVLERQIKIQDRGMVGGIRTDWPLP